MEMNSTRAYHLESRMSKAIENPPERNASESLASLSWESYLKADPHGAVS